MTAPSRSASAPTPLSRDRVTWAAYLALAQFTFFLNIQGNIIPFLKDEFHLSYRLVTLHPAAVAAGLIVCGLTGERLTRRYGRRWSVAAGLVGLVVGALLIVVAPHAAAGGPDANGMKAFIATGKQGVTYRPDTWHHGLTVLDRPGRFAVFMWRDGGKGDEEFVPVPPFTVRIP